MTTAIKVNKSGSGNVVCQLPYQLQGHSLRQLPHQHEIKDGQYQKNKRKIDVDGKIIKLKDTGKKRKLAARCSTITACIEKVLEFRREAQLNLRSLVNLNSTYVIHSRFERAERLQPGWAKFCDMVKMGSADAHEEAKKIIVTRDHGNFDDGKMRNNLIANRSTRQAKNIVTSRVAAIARMELSSSYSSDFKAVGSGENANNAKNVDQSCPYHGLSLLKIDPDLNSITTLRRASGIDRPNTAARPIFYPQLPSPDIVCNKESNNANRFASREWQQPGANNMSYSDCKDNSNRAKNVHDDDKDNDKDDHNNKTQTGSSASEMPVLDTHSYVVEGGQTFMRPVHPLVWEDYNLCDMYVSGTLDTITLRGLNKIFQQIGVEAPRGSKALFIQKLQCYLDYCPCQINCRI